MNELLQRDIQNLEKRITALEHSLWGNGKQGIKEELIILKTEIHSFKRMAVWQIGIGVAILCAVIGKLL